MSQFVGGGEDPALHRNPVPHVHHDRRTPVLRPHAESEERIPLLVEKEHLDAAVFQEPADVGNRGSIVETCLPPCLACDFDGARRAALANERLEPELPPLVQCPLEPDVVVQPAGDLGEGLRASVHGGVRPKPNIPKRPHGLDQVPDGNAQGAGHGGKRPGAGQDDPALDLPQRHAGQTRGFRKGGLGHPPVQPQPGDVLRDTALVSHGSLPLPGRRTHGLST